VILAISAATWGARHTSARWRRRSWSATRGWYNLYELTLLDVAWCWIIVVRNFYAVKHWWTLVQIDNNMISGWWILHVKTGRLDWILIIWFLIRSIFPKIPFPHRNPVLVLDLTISAPVWHMGKLDIRGMGLTYGGLWVLESNGRICHGQTKRICRRLRKWQVETPNRIIPHSVGKQI